MKSSNDNDHYFAGFKKHIDLKLSYFSATFINVSGTFTNIDAGSATMIDATVSPIDGAVYVTYSDGSTQTIRKSLAGQNIFRIIDVTGSTSNTVAIAVSPIDGAVYVAGQSATETRSTSFNYS